MSQYDRDMWTQDLKWKEGILYLDTDTWRDLLAGAEEYGWEPLGTSDSRPWDRVPSHGLAPSPELLSRQGGYLHGDGEWVEPQDSADLGCALESAVSDCSDDPSRWGRSRLADMPTDVVAAYASFFKRSEGFRLGYGRSTGTGSAKTDVESCSSNVAAGGAEEGARGAFLGRSADARGNRLSRGWPRRDGLPASRTRAGPRVARR